MTRNEPAAGAVPMADQYDVVVIGGGAAGLSGALMLGRARRSALVIDSGQPRNAPAARMHGFLSRDGMPPTELLAIGRQELTPYGGEVVTGQVESVSRRDDVFAVSIQYSADEFSTVRARRLLVASGIVDELPDIPGLARRWGRDVLHCPYCHGWEFRDEPIGILGTNERAAHQALLLSQWSENVTLIRHSGPELSEADREKLAARNIPIVTERVSEVEITGDELSGVRLESGRVVPIRALVVAPRPVARASMLADIGLVPTTHPSGFGDHIATVDPTGRTAVAGVWAAGNVAEPMESVPLAVASGTKAGAMINMDLIEEDTERAVEANRPFSVNAEAKNCEQVLAGRNHGI